jgi:hypothetical protein
MCRLGRSTRGNCRPSELLGFVVADRSFARPMVAERPDDDTCPADTRDESVTSDSPLQIIVLDP